MRPAKIVQDIPLTPNPSMHSTAEEIQEQLFCRKPNPLPRIQLANVLLVYLCSAFSQLSILPFINQFVSELGFIGVDKRKVGIYVGLLESILNISSAITVLSWSRLSDKIGRKPVMLFTVVAIAICMLCLGLSRTFVGLVARFVHRFDPVYLW